MIKQFRFVGAETIIGNTKLDRFGMRVNLDEKFAKIAVAGGAALLSEENFNSIGFDDQDLKVWADPFIDLASYTPVDNKEAKSLANFIEKRRKAQQMFVEQRQAVLAPVIEQPQPKAKA